MNAIETVKNILAKKVDISNLKETDSLSSLGLDSLDLVIRPFCPVNAAIATPAKMISTIIVTTSAIKVTPL